MFEQRHEGQTPLHCLIPYKYTGCFGLLLVLSCLETGSGCVAPGSVELPI